MTLADEVELENLTGPDWELYDDGRGKVRVRVYRSLGPRGTIQLAAELLRAAADALGRIAQDKTNRG